MGYVNMFNRGVSRVKNMMIENGSEEPVFNVDKITAFEVISYSAIKHADLHDVVDDFSKIFPKIFPKLIDKLIPTYIQEKDRDIVVAILSALVEPKSAKDLASIASCSVRTIKDKYLDKMLEAEVITMTIPDKPTSRNQKYKMYVSKRF